MKTKTLLNTVAGEVQLAYSIGMPYSELRMVTCSRDADSLFRLIWEEPIELYESFYILLLNKANRVLAYRRISTGGVSGTVVDPKSIFQSALLVNASALILAHNHPSGNLKSSEADQKITTKVRHAGELMDISVLDHLILTRDSYFSFADEGLM